MNKRIFFLVTVLLSSGCAKLAHLDQLLTLKAISENREEQKKFVKAQDKNFDRLVEAAKKDQLKDYSTSQKFLAAFGEPLLKHSAVCESQACEEWLYRHATKYFNGEKVYVYFQKEKLHHWEHIVPPLPDQSAPSTQPAAK